MKEELLDVLDENGVKTGEVLPRKVVHEKGLWHRAIVVAIINDENKILLQQRSENKEKNAGMWDISVAGHLSSGQDSLAGANREISEEVSVNLGFSVKVKDFRFMTSFRKIQEVSESFIERQFYDFFILRQEGLNDENIKMQESEVQAIKFVTVQELNELREKNLLVDREEVYNSLIEYLFRL
ncbi:MAG: NUDIX domain-containing protein [Bacilli bacterium]|jgi:isopentenyldiphosphate isomerase|nr:NUDIX domain-containing protein [Bacilli bacterium]